MTTKNKKKWPTSTKDAGEPAAVPTRHEEEAECVDQETEEWIREREEERCLETYHAAGHAVVKVALGGPLWEVRVDGSKDGGTKEKRDLCYDLLIDKDWPYALGGHLKTGQSWSGQNRPVA